MKTKRIPFNLEKAKAGAKVITRAGNPVRIKHFNGKIKPYTVVASIEEYGIERTLSFTELGQHVKCCKSEYDLFIEEEVKETDDYNPYKEVVKSITDMDERYAELQSLEELKHFYNNVKVKCRDAFEYGKVCMINLDEKPADNKPKSQKGDWSIQDAKPGDILASTNGLDILIFKEIDNSLYFSSFYNIRGRGEYYWTSSNFIPATKEQRELLFKKMKEEGYEWNPDKKELHKIKKDENRRLD